MNESLKKLNVALAKTNACFERVGLVLRELHGQFTGYEEMDSDYLKELLNYHEERENYEMCQEINTLLDKRNENTGHFTGHGP